MHSTQMGEKTAENRRRSGTCVGVPEEHLDQEFPWGNKLQASFSLLDRHHVQDKRPGHCRVWMPGAKCLVLWSLGSQTGPLVPIPLLKRKLGAHLWFLENASVVRGEGLLGQVSGVSTSDILPGLGLSSMHHRRGC